VTGFVPGAINGTPFRLVNMAGLSALFIHFRGEGYRFFTVSLTMFFQCLDGLSINERITPFEPAALMPVRGHCIFCAGGGIGCRLAVRARVNYIESA